MRVAMERAEVDSLLGRYAPSAVVIVHKLGRSPLASTQLKGRTRIREWLVDLVARNPVVLHATVGDDRFALAFERDFAGGRQTLTSTCDMRDGQIVREEVSPSA
jgi:hypothetical protein